MGGAQSAFRDPGLLEATRSNDLPRVKSILRQDDIKVEQDRLGNSPLHWAVVNANHAMLRELLTCLDSSARTLTRKDEYKAIVLAAARKNWRGVLTFAERPAVERAGYDIALLYAVQDNQFQVVKALLESHAGCNARAERLQRTALHYAIINRNPAILRLLLEAGADQTLKDADQESPLQLAVKRKHWDCVKVLAEHYIEEYAELYSEALIIAVREDQYQAALALLEAGANPNHLAGIHDKKRSPLHWSAINNNPELAALLLRYGANIDAKDVDEDKAINIAIRDESRRFLAWLLDHKEKEKPLDDIEDSPELGELLRWAADHQKKNAIQMFRTPGHTPYRPRKIEVLIGSSDIETIIKEHDKLDLLTPLANGLHPLSYAVKLGLNHVVETLLEYVDKDQASRNAALEVAVLDKNWACASMIDPEQAMVTYLDKQFYSRLSFFSAFNRDVKQSFVAEAKKQVLRHPTYDQARFWKMLSLSETAKYHQFKRWSHTETRTMRSCIDEAQSAVSLT